MAQDDDDDETSNGIPKHLTWKSLEGQDEKALNLSLQRPKMQWAGHVVLMSCVRQPEQLLYDQLYVGKRPQYKPWKRYKDCLKSNHVNIKIDPDNWEKLALRRIEWRIHVDNGCTSFAREMY